MYKLFRIKSISTEKDGSLSFFESERDIPFAIKRNYYIYGAERGVVRGGHAHKELWQVLLCPYGSIKIILDDGISRSEILLDKSDIGLIIGPGLWHEMIWLEDNSVLCVSASDYYDEEDYIRNYEKFIAYSREK